MNLKKHAKFLAMLQEQPVPPGRIEEPSQKQKQKAAAEINLTSLDSLGRISDDEMMGLIWCERATPRAKVF